jgi:hypothetical protein
MPSGNIYINFNAVVGSSIDYVNTRKGRYFSLGPFISYNLGAHLRLNFYHTYETMEVADQHLYTANISEASIVYHFNTRIFLRSIFQYYNYEYNVSNYMVPMQPERKQFFTQLLFSYKINPRTVLFLGYSDNYFSGQRHGILRKDYTLFLKIGYAWVI